MNNILFKIGLTLAITTPLQASGYFQQDLFKQRSSGGVTTQWTLADWLKQKNAQALADQWLVLNSSNPLFDISASASGQRYTLKTDNGTIKSKQNRESQIYNLDMYVSIFGIHGDYELTKGKREEFGGSVGLRLLGSSSKSTFLSARYGIHVRHDLIDLEQWQNQYAEAQLQVYVVKGAGLNGKYRYYFPADSNLGNRLEGHRVTAGIFFDVLFFRVSGNYFQEPVKITRNGVEDNEDRTGYDFGVRLFF